MDHDLLLLLLLVQWDCQTAVASFDRNASSPANESCIIMMYMLCTVYVLRRIATLYVDRL